MAEWGDASLSAGSLLSSELYPLFVKVCYVVECSLPFELHPLFVEVCYVVECFLPFELRPLFVKVCYQVECSLPFKLTCEWELSQSWELSLRELP